MTGKTHASCGFLVEPSQHNTFIQIYLLRLPQSFYPRLQAYYQIFVILKVKLVDVLKF